MKAWVQALVSGFALILLTFSAQAAQLSNGTLTLQLKVTPEGIPIIEKALWQATGQVVFRDLGTSGGLSAWVPGALIPTTQTTPTGWNIKSDKNLITAEATRELANKIRITWIIDLPKQGQLFRLRIRLTNGGTKKQAVDWFPAWSARWNSDGQSPSWVRRWLSLDYDRIEAVDWFPARSVRWNSDGQSPSWIGRWLSLDYDRIEEALKPEQTVHLSSQLHSSDVSTGSVNPYWVVGGKSSRIYFGLQWSGGWSAKLESLKKGFAFSVYLPPEETQLILHQGETIEGPALLVTPVTGADDLEGRALWMRDRQDLGQKLYANLQPSFPLSYNTWYAAYRSVSRDFLNRQIAAMSPYDFAAFVVDAGWFQDVGWQPHKTKFPADSLANILASLKAQGLQAGLWSTPQYVRNATHSGGLATEQSSITSHILNGYLVDMSARKFADYLTNHVQMLRNRYAIDYWKYDQPFFAAETSAGRMKNVIGFQQALQAVRRTHPDLVIENCYNGGRMLNDFTLLTTQTSWLLDVEKGIPNPHLNIRSALNALEFVFPSAALRFTVNLDRMDQNDDEFLRLYCRSAMAGRWGISTDLSAISQRQQAVVLKEVENYRRLNQLKSAGLYDLHLSRDNYLKLQPFHLLNNLYDLHLSRDNNDTASVTFYDSKRLQAGILLYRWQRNGAFHQPVGLTKLTPGLMYRVLDVDTEMEMTASGAALISNGVNVAFSDQRQSALLFVEPVMQTPGQ
jgi:hypothetical protein